MSHTTKPDIAGILKSARIVPVIDLPYPDLAEPLAEALLLGGGQIAEMTLRSPLAFDALAAMVRAADRLGAGAKGVPLLVGAGTVLNADDLKRVTDLGASFAVSPGFTEDLLAAAASHDLPWVPGVSSASHIMRILDADIRVAKLFPAAPLGGLQVVSALLSPFASRGLSLMPTGGIGPADAADYLAIRGVVAVGGSWMVTQSLLNDKQWDKVQQLMAEAL